MKDTNKLVYKRCTFDHFAPLTNFEISNKFWDLKYWQCWDHTVQHWHCWGNLKQQLWRILRLSSNLKSVNQSCYASKHVMMTMQSDNGDKAMFEWLWAMRKVGEWMRAHDAAQAWSVSCWEHSHEVFQSQVFYALSTCYLHNLEVIQSCIFYVLTVSFALCKHSYEVVQSNHVYYVSLCFFKCILYLCVVCVVGVYLNGHEVIYVFWYIKTCEVHIANTSQLQFWY